MKVAMIITGVVGLVLMAIGCVPYFRAVKNEDAAAQARAMKLLGVASFFLTVFFILLVILVVRVLFSFLG